MRDLTRNGLPLWDTLLEALDVPGAVVAGGCIRDYFLGLEPKDIDLFVPIDNRQELEELIERLNDSSVWTLNLIEGEDYELHDPEGIVGVAEGDALGLPVNIIARCAHSDALALIKGFDFGILQMAYKDEKVLATAQAAMDLANREATLTHEHTHEGSLARFERFAKRNPGALRLVDPYALDLKDVIFV